MKDFIFLCTSPIFCRKGVKGEVEPDHLLQGGNFRDSEIPHNSSIIFLTFGVEGGHIVVIPIKVCKPKL
jgi:hypothetical protein